MLKLKRIQILGFKSFCDRTEVTLPGQGFAVVVGPNGCGKSNILDAVSWVLGEQSAKSLRGAKMEDVIFAGTRERKALGMAEVSLSLVDSEVCEEAAGIDPVESASGEWSAAEDWDEEKRRSEMAAETEDAIAEAQPGSAARGIDGLEAEESGSVEDAAAKQEASTTDANAVVLKIRRRKFTRVPARAGEITITRRLFRTGESEYLLNGKLCRLRDIQDIFMGTGLGPDSYAIIEQERIGQILSSKPHDRRSMIEEAAGVTRFKAKKRLTELRLESARQNLARVNDIFEEVSRQLGSLKRQAAKAERYAALREDLRGRMKIVLASRLAHLDSGRASLADEMAAMSRELERSSERVSALEEEYDSEVSEGYRLEENAKEANTRASQAAVDLERARARQTANRERVAELDAAAAAGAAECAQARQRLEELASERESQRHFLETAAQEAASFGEEATAREQEARAAILAATGLEQELESERRRALDLLSRMNAAQSQTQSGEDALSALEREAGRLAVEIHGAQKDLQALGAERGQTSLKFESAASQLERLESEIKAMRSEIESKRAEEAEIKRNGDRLRGEIAELAGRRSSLSALIREHSYSTDTVRKLLKSGSLEGGLAPVGTLADFLEVEGEYETVIDSFLRDELNYIVVKSWDAAHEGMRLLKSDVDGRATFLVHPDDAQAKFSFAGEGLPQTEGRTDGVARLKDCIRVLDGFGRSLEVILPKLRDGFLAPDAGLAKSLALENPNAFFLAPSGECFHNVTVTGGKPSVEGPLSLKRELREAERKLEKAQTAFERNQSEALTAAAALSSLASRLESANEERRMADRESANQSAALRQMAAEVSRLERRLADWTLEADRNREQRESRSLAVEQSREQAHRFSSEYDAAEEMLAALAQRVDELRRQRELRQQEAAAASARLAGLEERKRGAEASWAGIDRMHAELDRRVAQLERQLMEAGGEQRRRTGENEALAAEEARLEEIRQSAAGDAARWTGEVVDLRERLKQSEQSLKALRAGTAAIAEARSLKAAQAAKLDADLEYAEATCTGELGLPAADLRADSQLERVDGEALAGRELEAGALKQKLEAMGPVNMMALEEYNETAGRHGFLETQRRDLLDSIENTQSTIREIDQITRSKFDEAFVKINANFSKTFTTLFGGGQAFMRLTDEANSGESGIDIVASPPGKKMQNVLLLSGGEKALTALSLLVAIFEYQPSPFCVLDEVDAPLDEANVGRLAEMIRGMSLRTQFVLVTHSKRMMSAADLIYGVTMQEPGVSKLVSVHLSGQQRKLAAASSF